MISTTPRLFFSSLAALALLAAPAWAVPLSTDPAAFVKGSSHFLNTNNGVTLDVTVDFAVYEPGDFNSSIALGNPVDPSAGARYVYAYEIFSNGTTGLTSLSIGLRSTALVANIGHTAANLIGSTPPGLSQFIGGSPPSSAKWSYIATPLNGGQHSDILLFTSPYAPTFIQASVVGGSSTGNSQSLPTPIPEPSSVALSMIGALGLLAVKFFRRRTA